jgi:segregation and condensation protein A
VTDETAEVGAYRVRAGPFEGPLDLLLHLVRVNEVDVKDIPIVEITRQYNEILDLMRELDLAVAGEYVVMAATLMHIKSRMLLPQDPADPEAREDPRADLVQQLLDYEKFRQAAENLQAIDSVRSLVWTRDGRIPEEFAGEETIAVGLFDLLAAFGKLLKRVGDEARLLRKRDDVSVAEKIAWLTDLLEERGSIDLLEVLGALESRIERIATFLAVLEMARLRLVVAFQRKYLGEIRIALDRDAEPKGVGGQA